jgi:hypothetical protein
MNNWTRYLYGSLLFIVMGVGMYLEGLLAEKLVKRSERK